MPRFNFPQNNFLSGELSPRFVTRTEAREYFQGGKRILNGIPLPQGGVTRRPGSQLILTDMRQTLPSAGFNAITTERRLIPFVSSSGKGHLLVLGPGDGTDIATNENPPIWDVTVGDLNNQASTDSMLPSTPVDWLTNYSVTISRTKTWKGYSASELKEVQYAQVGDTVILVHPNHVPLFVRLLFEGSQVSTWVAYPFYADVPVLQTGLSGGTFVDSASVTFPWYYWPFLDVNTNTNHTLTIDNASVGTGKTVTSSKSFFASTHVGALFKVTDGNVTGVFEVTGYTSATSVTVSVLVALPGTSAYSKWEESAWSDFRGWPRTVCSFQQRVIYGGNFSFPSTLWGSKIGNIHWMDRRGLAGDSMGAFTRTEQIINSDGVLEDTTLNYGEVVNSDAFQASIVAGVEPPVIRWLSADKNLIVGASGREYLTTGLDSSLALGPLNIGFSGETSHGSAYVQPVRVSNQVVFVQGDGQKLREFVFNFEDDAFRANDISSIAEHMPRKSTELYASFSSPKIIQLAYQEGENNIIWCLDNNGGLFGVCRNRQEGQIAWHFHKLGGELSDEPPKVVSIAVLPSSDQSFKELYMVVQRTIDSNTVYYIERMGRTFQHPTIDNNSTNINDKPIYLDCAKMQRASPATDTFTDFGYLEGETVHCVVDGSYVGTKTVSSSTITLDDDATELIAGLNYRTLIEPMVPEAGSAIGSALGAIKRIDKIVLHFLRTIGAKFGRDEDNLIEISMRGSDVALNDPTPLFTGQKVEDFPGDYERDGTVVVVQDDPLPFTLLGFSARGQTYD